MIYPKNNALKIDTQPTSSTDLKNLFCIHRHFKPYSELWMIEIKSTRMIQSISIPYVDTIFTTYLYSNLL